MAKYTNSNIIGARETNLARLMAKRRAPGNVSMLQIILSGFCHGLEVKITGFYLYGETILPHHRGASWVWRHLFGTSLAQC